MAKIESYRDLIVWQKSIQLVKGIYQLTRSFPKEELYGLVMQMRRSSVSIPSNIAEGYGRNSKTDYLRFLKIAVGSLYELQTQLEIATELGFTRKADMRDVLGLGIEIEKMLIALIRNLNNSKR